MTIPLLIAFVVSGFICYLLSRYFTQPIRSLRLAVKSLATGQLNTRVGPFFGHYNDEIAELSREFDRMAEHLETLIHSKERLLQDLSHELCSPLARLQVAIELARIKSPLAKKTFDRMELECLRLNTLIGEALHLARLDKSTDVIHKSWIDLPTFLTDLIDDANFEFVENRTCTNIDPTCTYPFMGDKRLIRRAVENILRNALRYSPKDKMVVISLHKDLDPHKVYIDIEDNGPGVPEDQLTKIFNPFYRVDAARQKETGGYGLGLTIAKQAIALHDGEIQVKNRKGGGLMLRIILPITPNDQAE
jgi:two-component system sensor histidine kinase CpxA